MRPSTTCARNSGAVTFESAAWSIRSGRLLRFGPDWPESGHRLTFDACSGDYWVLDALGHRVVKCLLDQGAQSDSQLKSAVDRLSGLPGDMGELEPVLERLLQAELVQRVHASAPE